MLDDSTMCTYCPRVGRSMNCTLKASPVSISDEKQKGNQCSKHRQYLASTYLWNAQNCNEIVTEMLCRYGIHSAHSSSAHASIALFLLDSHFIKVVLGDTYVWLLYSYTRYLSAQSQFGRAVRSHATETKPCIALNETSEHLIVNI